MQPKSQKNYFKNLLIASLFAGIITTLNAGNNTGKPKDNSDEANKKSEQVQRYERIAGIVSALFSFMRQGDIQSAEWLVDTFKNLPKDDLKIIVGATDDSNQTILMYASFKGYTNIVKTLLDYEVEIDKQSKNGATALMFAVSKNQTQIVKLLIDAGAQVNLPDNKGTTALMCAVRNNQPQIAKLLIDAGAQVNLQNNDGTTALMYALLFWHTEILRLLVNHGAQDLPSSDGKTALMTCIKIFMLGIQPDKESEIFHLLISSKKLMIDTQSIQSKDSALILAVDNNNEECVEKLLWLKPKKTLLNANGKTASDYAKTNKIKELLSNDYTFRPSREKCELFNKLIFKCSQNNKEEDEMFVKHNDCDLNFIYP